MLIYFRSHWAITLPLAPYFYVSRFSLPGRTQHTHLDNAVMIGWASMHRFLNGDTDDYSIEQRPKWSLHDLENPDATVDD